MDIDTRIEFGLYSEKAFKTISFVCGCLATSGFCELKGRSVRKRDLLIAGSLNRDFDGKIYFVCEGVYLGSTPIVFNDFKFYFNVIKNNLYLIKSRSKDKMLAICSWTAGKILYNGVEEISEEDFNLAYDFFCNSAKFTKLHTKSEVDEFVGIPANPLVASLRKEYAQKIKDARTKNYENIQKIRAEIKKLDDDCLHRKILVEKEKEKKINEIVVSFRDIFTSVENEFLAQKKDRMLLINKLEKDIETEEENLKKEELEMEQNLLLSGKETD